MRTKWRVDEDLIPSVGAKLGLLRRIVSIGEIIYRWPLRWCTGQERLTRFGSA